MGVQDIEFEGVVVVDVEPPEEPPETVVARRAAARSPTLAEPPTPTSAVGSPQYASPPPAPSGLSSTAGMPAARAARASGKELTLFAFKPPADLARMQEGQGLMQLVPAPKDGALDISYLREAGRRPRHSAGPETSGGPTPRPAGLSPAELFFSISVPGDQFAPTAGPEARLKEALVDGVGGRPGTFAGELGHAKEWLKALVTDAERVRPPGRADALRVASLLDLAIDEMGTGRAATPDKANASARTRQLWRQSVGGFTLRKTLYEQALKELIRQVGVGCAERGALLDRLIYAYRQLLEKYPRLLEEATVEMDSLRRQLKAARDDAASKGGALQTAVKRTEEALAAKADTEVSLQLERDRTASLEKHLAAASAYGRGADACVSSLCVEVREAEAGHERLRAVVDVRDEWLNDEKLEHHATREALASAHALVWARDAQLRGLFDEAEELGDLFCRSEVAATRAGRKLQETAKRQRGAQQQHETAEVENGRLREQIDELSEALAISRAEIARLEPEASEAVLLRQKVKDKDGQIAKLSSEMTHHRLRWESAVQELESARATLARRSDDAASLEAEVARAKAEAVSHRKNATRLEEALRRAQEEARARPGTPTVVELQQGPRGAELRPSSRANSRGTATTTSGSRPVSRARAGAGLGSAAGAALSGLAGSLRASLEAIRITTAHQMCDAEDELSALRLAVDELSRRALERKARRTLSIIQAVEGPPVPESPAQKLAMAVEDEEAAEQGAQLINSVLESELGASVRSGSLVSGADLQRLALADTIPRDWTSGRRARHWREQAAKVVAEAAQGEDTWVPSPPKLSSFMLRSTVERGAARSAAASDAGARPEHVGTPASRQSARATGYEALAEAASDSLAQYARELRTSAARALDDLKERESRLSRRLSRALDALSAAGLCACDADGPCVCGRRGKRAQPRAHRAEHASPGTADGGPPRLGRPPRRPPDSAASGADVGSSLASARRAEQRVYVRDARAAAADSLRKSLRAAQSRPPPPPQPAQLAPPPAEPAARGGEGRGVVAARARIPAEAPVRTSSVAQYEGPPPPLPTRPAMVHGPLVGRAAPTVSAQQPADVQGLLGTGADSLPVELPRGAAARMPGRGEVLAMQAMEAADQLHRRKERLRAKRAAAFAKAESMYDPSRKQSAPPAEPREPPPPRKRGGHLRSDPANVSSATLAHSAAVSAAMAREREERRQHFARAAAEAEAAAAAGAAADDAEGGPASRDAEPQRRQHAATLG